MKKLEYWKLGVKQNFVAAAIQVQDAPPPAQGYNPYPDHAPTYPSEQPPAAHTNRSRHRLAFAITVLYTTEFQKCGWRHCHLLLWIDPRDKIQHAQDID
nr:DNA helicase [Tanacetum cinerariifolium]